MEDYRYGGTDSECWEFGSTEWCVRCAQYGLRLLAEAQLPLSTAWAFSEEYCDIPKRLLAGRERAVYWFYVSNGELHCGAGSEIPAACLALPGFHIAQQWGLIAHASGMLYDRAGFQQRLRDEQKLQQELLDAGRPPTGSFSKILESKPKGAGLDSPNAFPAAISKALRDNPKREGLHNAGARFMKPSPEIMALPKTKLGVPVLSMMTEREKLEFFQLLKRPYVDPPEQGSRSHL